jgi:hypothetical protein
MDNVPVFVKIDDFKEIAEIVGMLREKLGDAKHRLEKLSEIKAKEDAMIDKWRAGIEEVEHHMEDVDKMLQHE